MSGHPQIQQTIILDIVDLVANGVLFVPAAWITWNHGKAGMACWPMVLLFCLTRFVADIYQITMRDLLEASNQVAVWANAIALACLSLAIAGLIYEARAILPPKQPQTANIFLCLTHLANVVGIGAATYAGMPTRAGGIVDPTINIAANLLMLLIVLGVCSYWWRTRQYVQTHIEHPNFIKAHTMLLVIVIVMPLHLGRLVYATVFAFTGNIDLDPIAGSFATRFFFLFVLMTGTALLLVLGGWITMNNVRSVRRRRSRDTGSDQIRLKPINSPNSPTSPASPASTASTSQTGDVHQAQPSEHEMESPYGRQ